MEQQALIWGFLVKHLNPQEIREIREMEDSLPPNKFLEASAICIHLDKLMGIVTDRQIRAMKELWMVFYKDLWKQRQIEDTWHPEGCTTMTCQHPWDPRCKTMSQEMHQWEDFVLRNYREPVEPTKTLDDQLRI
jgi:hypothetical protein